MNKAEVARAVECMREDGFSDREIEKELGVTVDPLKFEFTEAVEPVTIEDTEWVSCARCNMLPGDPCKLSPEDIESGLIVHPDRFDHVRKFADLINR